MVSDLQDEVLLLPPEHEVGAAVEGLQRWYMSILADEHMGDLVKPSVNIA